MEEMIVKLPKGIEERMEILIAENLYANKTEIINDALRRLIESELSVLINSHDPCRHRRRREHFKLRRM